MVLTILAFFWMSTQSRGVVEPRVFQREVSQ
jgi:hypothetical protein